MPKTPTKTTEKKQSWYFTFGSGQVHNNCYVRYYGTQENTREMMFKNFGAKWCGQYSEEQWNNPSEDSKSYGGFKPKSKVTLAEVWGWRELK